MSEEDRRHWDERFAEAGMATVSDHGPPPALAPAAHLIPTEGVALDLACGRGRASVWLAIRGMEVHGVDVSPVAIDLARRLAEESGVADRCRFLVHDLDDGLPDGPQVDLVLCHLFRDPRIDQAILDRVVPCGLVAVAVLSEVDAGPGPFRAEPGELKKAFGSLDVLADDEGSGVAFLLGRKEGGRRGPG